MDNLPVPEKIESLKSLCDETAQKWSQFQFQGSRRGTPGEYFAQKWTENNLAIPMSSPRENPFKAAMQNITTAIPFVAGAAMLVTLGPISLAITGPMMAAAVGARVLAAKFLDPLDHDDKVSREAFPQMREDLQKVLDQSLEVARSINIEMANSGAPESERLTALGEVEGIVRGFAETALGASSDDIAHGELLDGTVKRSKDSTAVYKVKKTLKEIDKEAGIRPMPDDTSSPELRPEIGLGPVNPQQPEIQKPGPDLGI